MRPRVHVDALARGCHESLTAVAFALLLGACGGPKGTDSEGDGDGGETGDETEGGATGDLPGDHPAVVTDRIDERCRQAMTISDCDRANDEILAAEGSDDCVDGRYGASGHCTCRWRAELVVEDPESTCSLSEPAVGGCEVKVIDHATDGCWSGSLAMGNCKRLSITAPEEFQPKPGVIDPARMRVTTNTCNVEYPQGDGIEYGECHPSDPKPSAMCRCAVDQAREICGMPHAGLKPGG